MTYIDRLSDALNPSAFRFTLENRRLDEASSGGVRNPSAKSIKTPLTNVKQTEDYSCGAAVLRSIFEYFGVWKQDEDDERAFIEALSSDPEKGTPPSAMLKLAKRAGLYTTAKRHMGVQDVIDYLDREIPVICCVQAWGESDHYDKRSSGHYIIAIGYDDENVYFQDPAVEGDRGFMSFDEFNERWYDKGDDGAAYDHFGMAMWLPNEGELGEPEDPVQASPVRKAKKIE